MKILSNRKIEILFCRILAYLLVFTVLSVVFLVLGLEHAAIGILVCALCAGAAILAACFCYFKEQNEIMEQAVSQITEYLSGDHTARIDCNKEGELYRLFHEVNSLVSILEAHAESEGKAKAFLKDTISNISHQLKTPLAALNIYNGLLQDEVTDPETVKELTALSEQELDRIERLVQNLLKIAKLDADSIVLERTPENVADMMKDMELQFAYRTRQEQKEMILSGPDNAALFCDRNWMLEALGNIVKNALDHTKSGDFVRIEWSQSASAVQIRIKDNGSGIHPKDLYHIFKRFYRSRFSKDTQGIGLGLPLAKAVIEAHGGTVEVDSECNVGTTFIIHFLIPTKL